MTEGLIIVASRTVHPGKMDARPYEPEKGTVRRVTAGAIKRRKGRAIFPIVTAYDAPFAQFAEKAGIDVILVGDSVGNVVLGYDETTPVTIEDMIHHASAVVRGTSRAHIMVDMPFGSYQVSDEDATRNAIRLVKDGGACSVKMEGGTYVADRIRAIYAAGIPVVGHIGVMPQTASLGPGYKMRNNRERLIADATSRRGSRRVCDRARGDRPRSRARANRDADDSDHRHRLGSALRFTSARSARRARHVSGLAEFRQALHRCR